MDAEMLRNVLTMLGTVLGAILVLMLVAKITSMVHVEADDARAPIDSMEARHFYEYPAEHMVKRHYGIRTERYKLIHFYNNINWWELYDLQADPTEMHNLYGQPEYESIAEELKVEMEKLQEQYNDPVRFSPERDKE